MIPTMRSANAPLTMAGALQPQPQPISAMLSAPRPYAEPSRIPDMLDPRMKDMLGKVFGYADQRGWEPRVLSGFRTQAEQDDLTVAGRPTSKGISRHQMGQGVDMALGGWPSDSPQMRELSNYAKTLGMRSGFDFDPLDPGHIDLGDLGSRLNGPYQRDNRMPMRNDPLAGMNYQHASVMRSAPLAGMAYRAAGPAAPAPMAGVGYRGAGPVRADRGGNSGSSAGDNQRGATRGGLGPRGRQGAR